MEHNFEDYLIAILTKSLEKNGNQPLTISHLLNIVKLAKKTKTVQEQEEEDILEQAYTETFNDMHKYGTN